MSKYTPKPKTSRLKILSGGQRATRIHQGGVSPSDAMPAGTYKAVCESARIASKWGRPKIECSFRVVEGEHFGTALPGWIDIRMVGDVVMPGCEYTKVCERILGHDLEPDEEIDPESVLVGKLLFVDARFRLTDGKSRTPQDGRERKDAKDFLRVCSVLGAAAL